MMFLVLAPATTVTSIAGLTQGQSKRAVEYACRSNGRVRFGS